MPPLAGRLAYLNFRYFLAAFYRLGHPLRKRLGVLGALNMSRCIKGYSDDFSNETFTQHSLDSFGRWTYGEETVQEADVFPACY
jgi:hypothetical protein